MGRIKRSYIIFFVVIFFVLLFFHTRGLILHDEGYILNSAAKVLDGQTIYKNFHFSYTPLSVYATVISFLLFGKTILASRFLMIFLSLISCFLLFKTAILVTKRDIYGYITTLLYLAWGPTHINFSWPVMFVLPLTFLIFYLIAKFNLSNNVNLAFAVGFLSFMVFLAKQNFGIIIVPVLLHFLFVKNKRNNFIFAVYGFCWGLILFITFLLLTKSLPGFVNDFYEFTFKKILFRGDLTTPLLFVDTPLKTVARAFLYYSTGVLSVLAIFLLLYRKRAYLLFLPLTVLLYSLIGLRPTTDYIHLIPILSLIGIPLIILMNQLPIYPVKTAGYVLLTILIVLGFQTALFTGYYRWDIPLAYNNYFLGSTNADIFVNSRFRYEFLKIESLVDKYSKKGDYLYIDSYSPMYYFLLDRKNVTKYDFPGFTDDSTYERYVVYALITKKVPLVILPNNNNISAIQKFIHLHYRTVEMVGNNYILIRNNS